MSIQPQKRAILRDRLYVPGEFCTQEILNAYETQMEVGEDPFTREKFYQTHYHYSTIQVTGGEILYAFNRGDLGKLYKVFHDFEIQDDRLSVPMSHSLKIRFPEGKSWRDYQPAAIDVMSGFDYGILKSMPRSGKTLMMTALICLGRQKTIVFAHQTDLLVQLLHTMEEFTNLNELREKTGQRIVGLPETWEEFATLDVALCTKQTFDHPNNRYKAQEIRNLFGAVHVDECHFVPGDVYSKLVNRFPAKIRQGVTATPKRKDGMDLLMESVLGPVVYEVDPGQIGQVPMEVMPIQTGTTCRTTQWAKMLSELAENANRNDLILRHFKEDVAKGYTIIAVTDRKQHGILLSRALGEMGIVSVVFNGSLTDKTRRKAILDSLRNGEAQVMIGMRSMTTGLDLPRADMFYNLLPCANAVRDGLHEGEGGYEQQISRVRTPFPGKTKCYVKDFVDRFGMAYACLKQREKTYRKVGATLIMQKPIAKEVDGGGATSTSFG